jgi:large subunit ribosomal protein L25
MKQVKVEVSPREEVGSGAVTRLRKSGRIPAVLYGESGVRTLSLDTAKFKMLWKEIAHVTALLELAEPGKEETQYAIIQDVQRDAVSDAFLHIDFKEVVRGKPMEAHVALRLIGIPFGVKNEAGVLEQQQHEIYVRCRPRDLPEFIEVDVTALHNGDSLHVREMSAPEGVDILTDGDIVIAAVAGAGGPAEADTEEAATA